MSGHTRRWTHRRQVGARRSGSADDRPDRCPAVSSIRVLWLIKGLGPGGAESLLASTARRIDRHRFDPEVAYLLPGKSQLAERIASSGVPVRCLGVNRELDLRWALRLRRLLVAGRFDVVHAHSPYAAGIARAVARTIPRDRRPAVVSTEHNQWDSYALLTRLLVRLTYPFGSAWLTVSEQAKASLPPAMRRRAEVLVHGVDLDALVEVSAEGRSVREELDVSSEQVMVVTVANLRPQKGYPDLLRAAAIACARDPWLRFVVVGQGPQLGDLQALQQELGLSESRFTFLGHRPDAVRVVAGADLFALASHYEGYPVALMEALAVGLPVVATKVSGVVDAVTDGVEGLLVDPHDPPGFAAAITALAADPDRRTEMARAAAARGTDFDIGPAVRRTETIYEDVVRSGR